MRVAVVGGGIFGQVVTWRLAVLGASVVHLEAVGPAHAESQSGDLSRVVRGLYGHGPFSESGARSLSLWKQWSTKLGVDLVERCGVLYIQRAQRSAQDDAFARYLDDGIMNLMRLGVALELMTPEKMAQAYPAISPEGVVRAVLEPGAGYGRISLATRTFAEAAAATGKVEQVTARVTSIETKNGRASGVAADVAGASRTFDADVVVVAAGLGGIALVEPLAGGSLGVRPIPHFVTYWDMAEADAPLFRQDRLPVWAEFGADRYGFPDDGESGFKAAWHEPLRTDPRRAEPSDDMVEELRRDVSLRFPALERAKLRRAWRCTYDATADENFQIGWVPSVEGLYLVGGLSGHGFKHAPAIGESVAATVMGKAATVDLSSYALRIGATSG